MIGLTPDPELVDAFEATGGKGKPRLAQLHVCWATSDEEARSVAHRWWPIAALPPRLLTELARPQDFAAAVQLVSEDAVAARITCGPNPDAHARAQR